MARKIVNGTVPQIGATFGTTVTITAATNAAASVFSVGAGHGVVVGEMVEVLTNGWPRAAQRVFRVSVVATNDLTIEGFDTTSTTLFPAGQGTGTLRRIITWSNVQQITAFTVGGGEQEFQEGQYIDSALKFRYPTSQTPIDVDFELDDDQSLAFWTTVRAAQTALTNYPFRAVYAGTAAGVLCGTGIWTYSAAPGLELNQVHKRKISVAMGNSFTEYQT